jgi:hypothetical protein
MLRCCQCCVLSIRQGFTEADAWYCGCSLACQSCTGTTSCNNTSSIVCAVLCRARLSYAESQHQSISISEPSYDPVRVSAAESQHGLIIVSPGPGSGLPRQVNWPSTRELPPHRPNHRRGSQCRGSAPTVGSQSPPGQEATPHLSRQPAIANLLPDSRHLATDTDKSNLLRRSPRT